MSAQRSRRCRSDTSSLTANGSYVDFGMPRSSASRTLNEWCATRWHTSGENPSAARNTAPSIGWNPVVGCPYPMSCKVAATTRSCRCSGATSSATELPSAQLQPSGHAVRAIAPSRTSCISPRPHGSPAADGCGAAARHVRHSLGVQRAKREPRAGRVARTLALAAQDLRGEGPNDRASHTSDRSHPKSLCVFARSVFSSTRDFCSSHHCPRRPAHHMLAWPYRLL